VYPDTIRGFRAVTCSPTKDNTTRSNAEFFVVCSPSPKHCTNSPIPSLRLSITDTPLINYNLFIINTRPFKNIVLGTTIALTVSTSRERIIGLRQFSPFETPLELEHCFSLLKITIFQ
jgi:hypothetical protein